MAVTALQPVGIVLILLAFIVAGPGRLAFAITRRRRRFGSTPGRVRGAVAILIFGAGAGLVAAPFFGASSALAAAQGAVFGLVAYYVARLAWAIWPVALVLVAALYAPLWHLVDVVTRAAQAGLRAGGAGLVATAQQAFFYHRAYWPNREGIMEILTFPPLWFAAPALGAVFFAWARARGLR